MIKNVNSKTVHFVTTDESEYNQYIRYGSNNWSVTIGESEEPVYDCEELEKEFQLYQEGLSDNKFNGTSERCFIVSYNHGNGKMNGSGQIDITTNGGYLNMAATVDMIKSKLEYEAVVVITNIIELSESDYNHWKA